MPAFDDEDPIEHRDYSPPNDLFDFEAGQVFNTSKVPD